MDPWPHDIGRSVIGGTHIFVLRLTLEPGGRPPSARLRLEAVETGEMNHFSEVSAAVEHLRGRLEGLIAQSGGSGAAPLDGTGPDPRTGERRS